MTGPHHGSQKTTPGAPRPRLITRPEKIAEGHTLAAIYAAEFARVGTAEMVSNATSQVALLRHGEFALPVTIDHGGYGRTYVASPHSAYVLYARDEIEIVGIKRGKFIANAALSALDRLLRGIRTNHAVHLDNWLLSTNLHGSWRGEGLIEIRSFLSSTYPDHFLILRSLDEWSCPGLLAQAKADGWTLLPSRQIWVTDDLERDWKPRNNYANDRRALRKSGLIVEETSEIGDKDAERIADLYHQLYVGRYSAINPVFTPRYIQQTAHSGVLHYRLARDTEGTIMAVAGMRATEGFMTIPVLGYDLTRPQSDALYRIASFLFAEWAMERGLKLHGSSGAGDFKRRRGAHPVIEYMAVYARHLSASRRTGIALLEQALRSIMVPMMQRQGW